MINLVGIDGGGTRTTLVVADAGGRELVRRVGPPGLVDPRKPEAAVEMLAGLARAALAEAGVEGGAAALCAGLAGVRSPEERAMVERALVAAGLADRAVARGDGEIALEGALAGGAGILLIAGTGSVGWGRGEDGRVERCGGWGLVAGDEGSAYMVGRAVLRAVAQAVDGRGPATALVDSVLEALGMTEPDPIRPWAGRAEKAEVAALAVHATRLAAAGDGVAGAIVRAAAEDLAAHARALAARLGPWRETVPVVLYGGLGQDAGYARWVAESLVTLPVRAELRPPVADAVTGAVRLARAAAG